MRKALLGLMLLLVAAGSPSAWAAYSSSPHGIQGLEVGSGRLDLENPQPGIFLLRLTFDPATKKSASSIFLDPDKGGHDASRAEIVKQDDKVGLKTPDGQLLMDIKSEGWTLQEAKGEKPIVQGRLIEQQADPKLGPDGISLTIAVDKTNPPRFYGSGNGDKKKGGLLQESGNSHLSNGLAVIPYYWCSAGYAAFGVTDDDDKPAKWTFDPDKGEIIWFFPGKTAALYLMPARDLREAARAYARLSGYPLVPPKWSFGYLQSRWGWTDKAYIDETLKTFRDHKLPVDAFIFDFECYTTRPDYALPPEGQANFPDFTWNPLLFPHPAADIAAYRRQGLRVVPIRKPRIGDTDTLKMMHEKNWVLVSGKNGEKASRFDARGINYENPVVRDWYAEHLKPMIEDGVAGWWNDEGESTYTKYYYWNKAEFDALEKFRPNARPWSVNRAFQPGLQRLGAAAWTGDIQSTWEVLAQTPANLLNWSLAGEPYSTCDIGGFTGLPAPTADHPHATVATPPDMTTRWMQEGVFFPVMRSHSTSRIPPHFPWLAGPEAEAAMRQALELRYRLIPFYYSLAHEAHETGLPLMRPLLMEFPDDPKVVDLADQWLMGTGLMAAPILSADGKRRVYFPDDMFVFESARTHKRGEEIDVTARLDEIPVYVRAGTILPLGPVVQDTDEMPGGPLELQIYPGRDAEFTLVEDDGVSNDYLKGKLLKSRFTWNDASRTLNWKRDGDYHGKDIFTKLRAVIFDPAGKKEQTADFGAKGQISFQAN